MSGPAWTAASLTPFATLVQPEVRGHRHLQRKGILSRLELPPEDRVEGRLVQPVQGSQNVCACHPAFRVQDDRDYDEPLDPPLASFGRDQRPRVSDLPGRWMPLAPAVRSVRPRWRLPAVRRPPDVDSDQHRHRVGTARIIAPAPDR